MGIAKMAQSYGGNSQTISGLGQPNHGISFNTLEENTVNNFIVVHHSASPQKRIQSGARDFSDLANLGGLYHHTTTGMATLFIESKDTLPQTSELFSGRHSVDGG